MPSYLEQLQQMLAPVMQQQLARAQNPRQNLFLPEPGTANFFGQHPRVSNAIENAALFASNFQGGDTIGENISGVARGLIGVPQARESYRLQQMMAPFSTAQALAGLEKAQSDVDLSRAHAEYYRGRANVEARGSKYDASEVEDDAGYRYKFNIQSGQWERGLLPGQPEPPAGYKPSFKNEKVRKTGFQEWMFRGASAGDPEAANVLRLFTQAQGGIAGARTGSTIDAQRRAGDLSESERMSLDIRLRQLATEREGLAKWDILGTGETLDPDQKARLGDIDREVNEIRGLLQGGAAPAAPKAAPKRTPGPAASASPEASVLGGLKRKLDAKRAQDAAAEGIRRSGGNRFAPGGQFDELRQFVQEANAFLATTKPGSAKARRLSHKPIY